MKMTIQEAKEQRLRDFAGTKTVEKYILDIISAGDTNELDKIKTEICDRATGRTTRIIDFIIQEYFNISPGQTIEFNDHHDSQSAKLHLLSKLKVRLAYEHHQTLNKHYIINVYDKSIILKRLL